GLALPVDRDAVTVAGFDVTVETVVGDIQSAVGKPTGEGRVVPVESLRERGVPVEEFTCLVGPELQSVACGPIVEFGSSHCRGGKIGVRGEAPGFGQQAVDIAHVRSVRLCRWGPGAFTY